MLTLFLITRMNMNLNKFETKFIGMESIQKNHGLLEKQLFLQIMILFLTKRKEYLPIIPLNKRLIAEEKVIRGGNLKM